ncbi:sensor histidine kinase [Kribbella antibiotica]|uniref:Oxygen sensor histidine kinase NreB n=1 Tax=Kribbella antibiotica TaxID=190195 RepID=A0A4R4ZWV1_9ACTN|nr:sensor histidine kinase [Kribbella antibiotica]TDD63405.1 sensor histidine kinase [Kribbella antibiotica]
MSRSVVSRLEMAMHVAFALIVVGSLIRLFSINSPLCHRVLVLSALLSVGYGLTVWGGRRLGRWQPVAIAMIAAVWLLVAMTLPTAYAAVYAWLTIPLACLILRALPPKPAIVAIGLLTGLLIVTMFRQSGNFELFLPPAAAILTTVALYAAQQRDTASRQRLVEDLADLLDELADTREQLNDQQRAAGALAERARLAREIHDTLTQELAGSRMLLQAADRDWNADPVKARQRVQGVAETLGQNVVQSRRLIADLTPAELEDGSLQAALTELCRREQQYGAAVELEVTGEPRPISPELETALLRTAQGALANVRDHAAADRIHVVLDWRLASVRLEVRDNGSGAEPTPGPADRGYGLPGLRERLRGLGGTLTLDSRPGRGTALTADVPIGSAG